MNGAFLGWGTTDAAPHERERTPSMASPSPQSAAWRGYARSCSSRLRWLLTGDFAVRLLLRPGIADAGARRSRRRHPRQLRRPRTWSAPSNVSEAQAHTATRPRPWQVRRARRPRSIEFNHARRTRSLQCAGALWPRTDLPGQEPARFRDRRFQRRERPQPAEGRATARPRHQLSRPRQGEGGRGRPG